MDKHYHEYRNKLEKRFKKIEGHVRAINKMIQEGQECENILIQISAVISALKSCTLVILRDHIKNCLSDYGENEEDQVTERFNTALKYVIKHM